MTNEEAAKIRVGDTVEIRWMPISAIETGVVTGIKTQGARMLFAVKTDGGFGEYQPEQIMSIVSMPALPSEIEVLAIEFAEKVMAILGKQ